MAYSRPLRTIVSFRLWPRLGLGLLLGSTGLALTTTLLLLLTNYASTAVPVAWAVTTAAASHGFDLSRKTPTGVDFQPLTVRTPTGQPAYAFADTYPYQGRAGLLPGSGVSQLQLRNSSPTPPYPTTVAGPMSAVQRSWSTVKLMFR